MPANAPKLYSHNVDVDRINNEMLEKLPGQKRYFEMAGSGPDFLIGALAKGCLSPENLYLKIGSAVMFTKNNQKEGFVNGTLGVVERFDSATGYPIVRTKGGKLIKTEPVDWILEENGKTRATITQLPLRLAWAITVHKSQGLSLDEAVMDLSDVFEYGQGYVALSRVRRLSGLHILGWNNQAFLVHPEVLAKDENFRSLSDEAESEFGNMPPHELKTKFSNFILSCGGEERSVGNYSNGNYRPKKKNKANTHNITLAIFNEGKNISQIAEERGLTEGTILSHIGKLFAQKKIQSADLKKIIPPKLEQSLEKIHTVFRRIDDRSLSPAFAAFNGEYTYDELRLARMLMED